MTPFALVAVLLCATPDNAAFLEGVRLLEDFEYEKATFRFEEALRDPRMSPRERAVVLVYLGMTLAELREDARAGQRFEDALLADPYVAVPSDAPPKVRKLMDDARARVAATSGNAAAAPSAPSIEPPPKAPPPRDAPTTTAPPPAAPVVDEEGGGTLWLMLGGATGLAGVLALAGAGAAGWLGYDAFARGQAAEFQDDAIQLRDQSVAAQVAAAGAAAVGGLLLATGIGLATFGLIE